MIGSNVSAVGMVEALGALDAPAVTYEDNYSSTLKDIAAFILTWGPEGIRPSDRGSLERVRLGESENLHGVEFRRTDAEGNEASCDLYVDLDVWNDRVRFDDAEGNIWREVSGARVRVSWSSWGSMEVDIASFRLALMVEVSEFAKRLKAEFSAPVYQLVATAAQRAQQTEEFRKAELVRLARSAVQTHDVTRKGMRVGDERVLPLATSPGLLLAEADGEVWNATVGGGESALHYSLAVSSHGPERTKVLVLRRVAS